MASLIEELQRREAAARPEVDEPRGEIAQLTERLAQAEGKLSPLELTRETVTEILGGAGTDEPGAGAADPPPAGSRPATPPGSRPPVPDHDRGPRSGQQPGQHHHLPGPRTRTARPAGHSPAPQRLERPPGVHLPDGGLVGIPLAAAISAALVAWCRLAAGQPCLR